MEKNNNLIVSEEEIIKELEELSKELAPVFKIESPSGEIIFNEFNKWSDRQKILLLLIGKYIAYKKKIIQEPSVSISTIAKELCRPMSSLSGPIKKLKKEGYVTQQSDKKYVINFHRIKEIIKEEIFKKLKINRRC